MGFMEELQARRMKQNNMEPSVSAGEPTISMSPETQASASNSGGSDVASAGAGAASMGSPGMAAANIGGSFLTSYLARRAQEFENRKNAIANAAQNYGASQSNALNSMGSGWRAALLK